MIGCVVPSILEDCFAIASSIRDADRQEIQAHTGQNPLQALVHGLLTSDKPRTIWVDGKPCGMFGTGRVTDQVGCVWLLGTDDIQKISRQFLRESKAWLEQLYDTYDLLFNYVDERNTVHIRWIEWLGFNFIQRHEKFGVEQRPFLEFVRIQ